jgi:hypothetical protein
MDPRMKYAIDNINFSGAWKVFNGDYIEENRDIFDAFFGNDSYCDDFLTELLYSFASEEVYSVDLFSALSGSWSTWEDSDPQRMISNVFYELVDGSLEGFQETKKNFKEFMKDYRVPSSSDESSSDESSSDESSSDESSSDDRYINPF